MDVRPGYKRTEVGVIPQDWEASKLGMHATFKTGPFGSALHQSDYVYDGIPVINPMQIVDGNIQPTPTMAITEQKARKLSEFRLMAGNVVIGRRGEMGRCAMVRTEQQGWLCGTGSMMIRVGRSLDARFIQRVLSSQPIITEIEKASVGSTMVNLNQGTLENLLIPFPPTKAEQEAIADALTDADALIESLEQLLTKKRQIKKGAMQELLTGKKRLPGFSGAWSTRRIDEISDVDPENLPSTTKQDFKFNYISLEQVDSGRLLSHSEVEFGTAPSRARRMLRHGDVLMSTVRPNLKAHLLYLEQVPNAVCSTGFAVLRTKSNVSDPSFLFAQLFGYAVNEQIEENLAGSNYPAINSREVRRLEIACPPKVEEQTAIATIFSDMDAEITALEAKLSKARQLKQGMMQELLTGRIRLL